MSTQPQPQPVQPPREGDTRSLFITPRIRVSSKGATDLVEFTYGPTFTWDEVDNSDNVGHDLSLNAEKNLSLRWLVRATDSFYYGTDTADYQRRSGDIVPTAEQGQTRRGDRTPTARRRMSQQTHRPAAHRRLRPPRILAQRFRCADRLHLCAGLGGGRRLQLRPAAQRERRHRRLRRLRPPRGHWPAVLPFQPLAGGNPAQLREGHLRRGPDPGPRTRRRAGDNRHERRHGHNRRREHQVPTKLPPLPGRRHRRFRGTTRRNHRHHCHSKSRTTTSKNTTAASASTTTGAPATCSSASTATRPPTTNPSSTRIQPSTVHRRLGALLHQPAAHIPVRRPHLHHLRTRATTKPANAAAGLVWTFNQPSFTATTAYDYDFENFDGRRSGLSKIWRSQLGYSYNFTPNLQTRLTTGYERADREEPRDVQVISAIETARPNRQRPTAWTLPRPKNPTTSSTPRNLGRRPERQLHLPAAVHGFRVLPLRRFPVRIRPGLRRTPGPAQSHRHQRHLPLVASSERRLISPDIETRSHPLPARTRARVRAMPARHNEQQKGTSGHFRERTRKERRSARTLSEQHRLAVRKMTSRSRKIDWCLM